MDCISCSAYSIFSITTLIYYYGEQKSFFQFRYPTLHLQNQNNNIGYNLLQI